MHPRWTNRLLGLLALVLWCYAAVRAHTVSFSYDETYTFTRHVLKNMFYQQEYDAMGGNHHLLNVWGMWASRRFFGESEFALRLPNLLAYVLYLYASARIALKARTAVLAVAVFVLLNIHPYLIDFFSLARGYGLACGFMMMSLWQAWRFFDEGMRASRLAVATAFASLATMSHVIMVNYLLAFGLAFVLLGVARVRADGFRLWRPHLLALVGVGAAGLAIILPNALGLFSGGSLNFGCDTLWGCMVRTVAEKIRYHVHYAHDPLEMMEWALAIAGLVCVATLIAVRRKSMWSPLLPFLLGGLTLGACVLSFALQQALFDVPLPQTRTALFLLPLAAFVLAAALMAWPGKVLPATICTLLCAPLLQHQGRSVLLTRCEEWLVSGEVRTALDVLNADRLPLSGRRPLVSVSSGFESSGSLPYYIKTRNWQWLANTDRLGQDSFPRSDYYLVEWDVHHLIDQRHCTELFHSATTGLGLYRDERARAADRTVLHRARFLRAENQPWNLPYAAWAVPPELAGSSMVLLGSVQAKELSDANWLSLKIELIRDGEIIEAGGQPSHRQVRRYGEWGTARAELTPRTLLLAGDSIRFRASPCFLDPKIEIGDADLWIMR